MIGQSHQMIFTADIGIRQDRFSKNRQIIPVLDQLSPDSLVRHNAAFQFNIHDLVIFDLKKIELLSKLRDLKRIEKAQLIHFLHMQFQLLHQCFHTSSSHSLILRKKSLPESWRSSFWTHSIF